MTTISCYIVEDDPQALAMASDIVENVGSIQIVGHSASIKDAAMQIKEKRPDFIILDVFLEDGNAFEFLGLFEEIDFKIIFTTSYAKYAIEAFKFSALDYLLKPYEEKELVTALDKVKQNLKKENYQIQLQTLLGNFSEKGEHPKMIILKNADAIYRVKLEDILYAKADNNYTTFYCKNIGEILVSKSLKSFEDSLKKVGFFRVHQSYLINLQHISSFQKRSEEVIINRSTAIPVAQSKKHQLIDLMQKF